MPLSKGHQWRSKSLMLASSAWRSGGLEVQWCSGAVMPAPAFRRSDRGLLGSSLGWAGTGWVHLGGGEDPLAITVFQRWVR
jgi:hypothetical protein